ncbi:DUF4254 domain-containing protein [Streptomyces sp. NBC_00820]|uniref:DUF4254 domain-containing protein n=1 Tax=Streptomyces sp. NBC_00820 TaxID=2975842 RepID=UPI002ED1C06B|nr:DUF4254 domain-containing protein [Streptomyces sp. NBC_00820]
MPEKGVKTDIGIPLSSRFMDRFASSGSDPHSGPDSGPDNDPVLTVADRLRRQHAEQWQAEDLSRTAVGDDHVLAAVKRRIDRLNTARARLIDELDAQLAPRLPREPVGVLHTETLGSVIDRICIAWVRADQISRLDDCERRAQLAGHQLRQLADAYDVLVGEVEGGLRRIPRWLTLKSYGEGRHGE